ncbi:MFS transporter [Paracoccus onubensis]|uniref:MFS transporter n=2 Tax=Paracoccus onubensis TaxID=1675788 RepID=A0A418T858_9RHOB|nr:MFS transporter [Paracoccus onubensis]
MIQPAMLSRPPEKCPCLYRDADYMTTTPTDKPLHASLALLVLIAFSGTLAMHIFVPALPQAALALHTDSQTIQLTVTVYILGLALGQLIYGPLSDAIGRRPAVLGALCIYCTGAVASYLATGIEFLIAARFLQALGGAGGLALTRVIVADTSRGISTTRSIAILNLILLLGPGLAPVIGAEIAGLFGWRTIFGALVLMGLITIALATRYLPETAAPSGTLNATRIYATFRDLLAGKAFFRAITGGAFGSTACYAYFVSAPFILTSEMGLSVQAVGYCVGSTLAAAAAGSLLTRAIVGRVRDRLILRSFSVIGVLAGLAFLIGAITDMLTPVSVVTVSLIILFAAGGLGPVAIGTTLRLAGSNVGSASGLYGCFQMLSGVICSFAAGLFTDHALGCGLVLFLAYLFCFIQFMRLKEQ